MKRKISTLVLALVLSLSFTLTAFATEDDMVSLLASGTGAVTEQVTSFPFSGKKAKKVYYYITSDQKMQIGTMKYWYEERSLLSDKVYVNGTSNYTADHTTNITVTLATGVGSSNPLYYSKSENCKMSAEKSANFKGPKVTFGMSITIDAL